MKIITRHYKEDKLINEDILNINGSHSGCPEVIVLQYHIQPSDAQGNPAPELVILTQQPKGLATTVHSYPAHDNISTYRDFVSTTIPEDNVPKQIPSESQLFIRGTENIDKLPPGLVE